MNYDDLKWLIMDTEWPMAIGGFFPSPYPQVVNPDNILHDQFCSNAAWKWRNEVSVYNSSVLDSGKKDFRNYKNVMQDVFEVMEKADVITCHNTDFDLKMLNVGFQKYGLGQVPEHKIFCTLKAARKYFRFPSNKLDALSKRFGGSGKQYKPDFFQMALGNKDEMRKSIKYCKKDVLDAEIILNNILPFARNIPRIGGRKSMIECCEACGSKRLGDKQNGGVSPNLYRRLRCYECGHENKVDYKIWLKHQTEKKQI